MKISTIPQYCFTVRFHKQTLWNPFLLQDKSCRFFTIVLPEREGSISTASLHGWLPVYLSGVSALSTQWIDVTKSWGVVGQRKIYCVATGKSNMSRVSPGLWQEEKISPQSRVTILLGRTVVVPASSQYRSSGSISWRIQMSSLFLP